MLTVLPKLPVNADNARAVAQDFSDKIAALRARNRITSGLASQLHADIAQKIEPWAETDKAQFQQWFNAFLREMNVARIQAIEALPKRKPFMYYFLIFACIKVSCFSLVALYGWVVGPAIFNQ